MFVRATGAQVEVRCRNGQGGVYVKAPHGLTWYRETDLVGTYAECDIYSEARKQCLGLPVPPSDLKRQGGTAKK